MKLAGRNRLGRKLAHRAVGRSKSGRRPTTAGTTPSRRSHVLRGDPISGPTCSAAVSACCLLTSIIRRVAARSLSPRPTGAGQFRTCLASLMVTDIGDDASWNVSAGDVGTVLGIAHMAGYDRVWIAGGRGVDALVGRQTRIHSDLDLAVDVTQLVLEHLLQAYGRHGYGVEADWRPSRVALVAGGARQVDVHPIVFDAQGTGWQCRGSGAVPVSRGRFRPRIDRRTSGGTACLCRCNCDSTVAMCSANATITTSPC
jgi:hypothetical protein